MHASSLQRTAIVPAVLLVVLAAWSPAVLHADGATAKLGRLAQQRALLAVGSSRVIVRAINAAAVPQMDPLIEKAGGTPGRSLAIINGRVASLPNAALAGLANNPLVEQISLDRAIRGVTERTGKVVGATDLRDALGYDGSGIGVAVIDSGVTPSHDDLTGADGAQRVARFVDFVNGRDAAYDDFGHGTHVAGIIGGNGSDSGGARTGIAPGTHLIVLKALDASGNGRISDVIAALDYVVANKDALNIRVVNLSLAAAVLDSYNSDPLTLAAKRVVTEGIVVVAAAGNAGRDSQGTTLYGGVTAPGNAPWVLTVGAASHMGTVERSDDVIAPFSSRGPGAVDYAAKPDIVAPGVGTESLSAPESALYANLPAFLLSGTVPTPFLPYMSLSGTSMAAPVISGTVALMLQANPALTPNAVKAILQYTSEAYAGQDELTQGTGLVNARGAVELARFFAEPTRTAYPASSDWTARVIWGNQLITGGRLTPSANAWATDLTWGAARTSSGENIVWGEVCSGGDCRSGGGALAAAWGASCADATCSTVTWGAGGSRNVVWGSSCGGPDCPGPWSITAAGGSILGDSQATTVVWGSSDGNTTLWGSTVVWGSSCSDPACEPVIWNKE